MWGKMRIIVIITLRTAEFSSEIKIAVELAAGTDHIKLGFNDLPPLLWKMMLLLLATVVRLNEKKSLIIGGQLAQILQIYFFVSTNISEPKTKTLGI